MKWDERDYSRGAQENNISLAKIDPLYTLVAVRLPASMIMMLE